MKKVFIFVLITLFLFLCACQPSIVQPEQTPDRMPNESEKEPQTAEPSPEVEQEAPPSGDSQNSTDFVVEENDDYRKIAEAAEKEDVRYKWIKAFLDRDVKECADLAGRPWNTTFYGEREKSYEEWYSFLKELEFGVYSVKERTEISEWGYEVPIVRFEFEIVKSAYDVFPVGNYVYDVTEGRMSSADWKRIEEKPVLEKDVGAFLDCLIYGIWAQDNIYDEKQQDHYCIVDAFEYFYTKNGGERENVPKAELEKGVKALFGIEKYVPTYYVETLNSGAYQINGHSGFTTAHRIESVTENGAKTEVVVQYFADIMSMVKSHKVKYVFETQKGDYPLRLTSVERISTGVFDPSGWAA